MTTNSTRRLSFGAALSLAILMWLPLVLSAQTGSSSSTSSYTSTSGSSNWVSHSWTFTDGATTSYILNRTDSDYLAYIANIEAQCRLVSRTSFSWMPNAGDSSSSNWQNFGIPNCAGGSTSSTSGTSNTTTTTTSSGSSLPTAPSGLALNGTATASTMPLRWTDNASNEDKFNIERKLTSESTYTFITQLAGSDITTYTDTGIISGATYDYRVQACRSGYGCSEYAYLLGVSSAASGSTFSSATTTTSSGSSTSGSTSSGTSSGSSTPGGTSSGTSGTSSGGGTITTTTTTTTVTSTATGMAPTVTQTGSITYADGRMRIGVSFSEEVDASTITDSTIRVINSATGERIEGTVTSYWSGADFMMRDPATSGVDYVIIVKEIKGKKSGIAMSSEYRSSAFRPSVTSVPSSPSTTYTTTTSTPTTTYTSSSTTVSTNASSTASTTTTTTPLTSTSQYVTTVTTSATSTTYQTVPVSSVSTTTSKWIMRTWIFKDGATTSYVLNRSDALYAEFLASVDEECKLFSKQKAKWRPNAGNDDANNWKNFGIPDCSEKEKADTATTTEKTARQGSISVRVEDTLGTPVEFALVTIWGADSTNFSGKTDEKGTYTATLPAGTYRVAVHAPKAKNDLLNAESPATLTVRSGGTAAVKIVLGKSTKIITGTVLYSNEKAVAGVKVGAYSSDTGNWVGGETDSNGTYQLIVSGGSWRIGIHPKSSAHWQGIEHPSTIFFSKDASTEIKAANFTVPAAETTLTVKALDENGKALSGVGIVIDTKSAADVAVEERERISGTTGDSGSLSFGVRSNKYYVRGFFASKTYVNPEEQSITLSPGRSQTVTLTFKKKAAVAEESVILTGKTTLDGNPASGAYIWAWSEKGESRNAVSAADGTFSVSLTKKNRWHVGASKEADRFYYRSSESVVETEEDAVSFDLGLAKVRSERLAEKVEVTQEASKPAVVEMQDGARLTVPSNAATALGDQVVIEMKPTVEAPSQAGSHVVGNAYEVNMKDAYGTEVKTFKEEVEIILPYDPEELKSKKMTEDTLKPSYYDETAGMWVTIENYTIDKAKNVIIARVKHLTRFAIVSAADVTPPSAPTDAKASTAASGAVLLSWKNPTLDFGFAKVYRSEKENELGAVLAAEVAGTNYSDSATTKNTAYYYTVRAVDPAGNESTNTGQVKAVGTGAGAAVTTAQQTGSFSRNLKVGSRGDDVTLLQVILASEKVFTHEPTGYFGNLTMAAVVAFQEKYAKEVLAPAGLDKGTGFVGQLTRQKLTQLVSKAR